MEPIIKKAIEGGWKPKEFIKNYVLNVGDRTFILDSPFDDPLFWQALGKACGWEKEYENKWMDIAHEFYAHNLVEGWSLAVKYLEDLVI